MAALAGYQHVNMVNDSESAHTNVGMNLPAGFSNRQIQIVPDAPPEVDPEVEEEEEEDEAEEVEEAVPEEVVDAKSRTSHDQDDVNLMHVIANPRKKVGSPYPSLRSTTVQEVVEEEQDEVEEAAEEQSAASPSVASAVPLLA